MFLPPDSLLDLSDDKNFYTCSSFRGSYVGDTVIVQAITEVVVRQPHSIQTSDDKNLITFSLLRLKVVIPHKIFSKKTLNGTIKVEKAASMRPFRYML